MPALKNALGEALEHKKTLMVAGAFDGLSARLIQRAGFDAVWASGFCISASKSIPDMSVLTATELLDRVAEMLDSTSIPLIVDCDEGYGHLLSTTRLVKQLHSQGVQSICIEDNLYPKINSFYKASQRSLVSTEAFCEKLRAIKDIAPEVVLIARTEALIAGLGLEEAVRRGHAYSQSGADLILLHSAYDELSQYKHLISAWSANTPMIVIPTMSIHAKFADFVQLGFKMVIYPNQPLRASVWLMEKALHELRDTGNPSLISGSMVPMDYIFKLTEKGA